MPSDAPAQELEALIALHRQGRLAQVAEKGEALAARHPDSVMLLSLLGSAEAGLGRFDTAIACFTKLVALDPANANARNNLGMIYGQMGRMEEAIACFTAAAERDPSHADARNNLGVGLSRLGRHDEAVASFRQALALKPDFAEAHFNLGNSLRALGRPEEAMESFRQAIALRPNYAFAHNNLGNLLAAAGRQEEALAAFARAIALKPDLADAHNNLGMILANLGRSDQAIAELVQAVRLNPAYAEARYNLGNMLGNAGAHDQAIACFEAALQLRPGYARARAQKAYHLAAICDWDGLAAEADAITDLGITGEIVPPFTMLALLDDPERHFLRARRFAQEHFPEVRTAAIPPPAGRPQRLRIGYFSADFHDHATMHLMARLFELHDRGRFEIHGFSYGPDTGDSMRARVKSAMDGFHDVRALSPKEIAGRARTEKIDIAVDLKGGTRDSRSDLFAYRAAPVQISYLGYPGTMAANFMDYILADKTVIPQDQQRYFSEKVIYLPESYQVNDNLREVAADTPTRAAMGLPETGFVFCCFNNSFKISAAEFDIWMRLLQAVEGSVLWLLKANRWAEDNLGRAAGKRGVDPARLVFAARLPAAQHLARHRLADLFLDTFAYNAHTTASDALWAGLPLVTKAGRGFPARVGASLLKAVGLPELVTDSAEGYERLALELATAPDRLAAIRGRLQANRASQPLFDSAATTRHIEHAFEETFRRYLLGADPAAIDLAAVGN
jgi:protein O-GlcNAc transferase